MARFVKCKSVNKTVNRGIGDTLEATAVEDKDGGGEMLLGCGIIGGL